MVPAGIHCCWEQHGQAKVNVRGCGGAGRIKGEGDLRWGQGEMVPVLRTVHLGLGGV